jgi:hypothetical protein
MERRPLWSLAAGQVIAAAFPCHPASNRISAGSEGWEAVGGWLGRTCSWWRVVCGMEYAGGGGVVERSVHVFVGPGGVGQLALV